MVIDNGSWMFRAGFAGEEDPRFVFPSVVGHRKSGGGVLGGRHRDTYVGDEACAMAGVLALASPVERGVVTNWDDMEAIFHHAFYSELRVDPAEHPVLLAGVSESPKANRERMAQLMFETFAVPSFSVASVGRLSLYSAGHMTGIFLEVGDGVTQIPAFYDGDLLSDAAVRLDMAGRDLTAWLQRILSERGSIPSWVPADLDIVRDIKERLCYVALDFEAELRRAAATTDCNATYSLPDGSEIVIASERCNCPELLFRPSFNGFCFDGIDQALFDSIMMCDSDLRHDLYKNIVLSGETTMFRGFRERIEREMVRRAPQGTVIRVIAPELKHAAWVGGSMLASMTYFPQWVITGEDYNDYGPGIVHRKCFD
jgi:actin